MSDLFAPRTDLTDFDVLHAVRLRGVVGSDPLAEMTGATPEAVAAALARVTAAGLVFEREGRRVSGQVLTEEGRAAHAELLAAWMADQAAEDRAAGDLARAYDGFLDHNARFKALCSRWQQVADDEAARWQAMDDLEDLHGEASVVLVRAGEVAPRFARYAPRLGSALEVLRDGDERYFTSPLVDSYHTIWFEAHEDFLLSLGRDRATEGSY